MVTFDQDKMFEAERQRMVKEHLAGRDITDPKVLSVMSHIPRQRFISPSYTDQAYDDRPLPIGMGQTISQPYIVALMTQCLELAGGEDILEIGTGSGYQTAILASLAGSVCTIEKNNQLSESAQAVLASLGIKNVEFHIGDGSCGWPGGRVFERIIITAAVPQIPIPLIGQLSENGIIVAPVGDESLQKLTVCRKTGNGLKCSGVCDCRFVKLIGRYGFAGNQS